MSYLNINIPKASSLPICFRRLTNLYIKVIRNSQIFCNDSQLLICKAISLRYFICGVVPFADVGASGINYSICIVPCSILKLFIEHCIVLNTILIARLTRMPVCIRCAGSIDPFPVSFRAFIAESKVGILIPFRFHCAVEKEIFRWRFNDR